MDETFAGVKVSARDGSFAEPAAGQKWAHFPPCEARTGCRGGGRCGGKPAVQPGPGRWQRLAGAAPAVSASGASAAASDPPL